MKYSISATLSKLS